MSSKPSATLTVVYQEDNGEKHYASVPTSSKYKDVLDSACECFEEHLPENWESHIVELQHPIGEGRWAVIHPSVFSEIAATTATQSGEIRLRVRLVRNQSRHNTGENNAGPLPAEPASSEAAVQQSAVSPVTRDPPPYAAATAPTFLVVDSPEPPISDPRHEAFCDRCKHRIHGIRYKCSTCEDFDYCSLCIGYAPLEHSHPFQPIINHETRLFRPMDQWRVVGGGQRSSSQFGIGHEAICDICETSPIVGTRYKCLVCPDWDVCQNCLERSLNVHPEHPFIKLTNTTDILLRNTHEIVAVATGLVCSVCQKEIYGPTFYECKNPRCRLTHLCVHCEASPLSLSCTHPLIKCRI